MATAIEAFYVDNNRYPDWATGEKSANNNVYPSMSLYNPDAAKAARRPPEKPYSVTTPISYVTSFFSDAFAPNKGDTFCYYSTRYSWIMWSPGPDKKYDLNAENIQKLFNPKIPQPSKQLIIYAYDPTNGTKSGGDVFRVKM